ncbi:hypothetical protein [Pseudomonas putida]|nr:hypothetical protein [Pseudomonas putida]
MIAVSANAAERNDLPSCYGKAHLNDQRAPTSGRLLNVVVDQTIPMPEDIQRAAWGNISRYVGPGDQVRLYSFSALVPGQYVRLLFAGTLDAPISPAQRDDIDMNKLRSFDACMAQQKAQFEGSFGRQFVAALRGATADLPKSEIMFALREVAGDQAKIPADQRILFVISDMLEHSDYTSFYAANKIRELNPAQELSKAQKNGAIGDLHGARVYVAGAGLITDAIKQNYRSGKTMDNLESFWRGYFEKSDATLADFGKPMLNVDLQ